MLLLLLYPLIFLSLISVLAWLFIFLHPARPWDFQPVGDDAEIPPLPADKKFPPVAVIVPARNEADSLPRTLPALLNQDYPAAFSITLVNDRSTDNTAEIARGLARTHNAESRLNVIEGAPLPEGWTGKVWAMNQGVKSAATGCPSPTGWAPKAQEATPKPPELKRPSTQSEVQFFLLTDADILHAPNSLRRLVTENISMNLAMNSRMARLRCESPAEKLLIPAFVYFFNILYPMRRVNKPRDPLASAAGGCVLLSREAWEKLGESFECIKSEIIDDVNLARQVKARSLPIRLSLSRTEVQSLREYPHLADIWKMVRRTAFTELRYSWLRVLGALTGLALMFAIPFVAIAAGALAFALDRNLWLFSAGLVVKGSVALAVMGHVYAPAMRFFKLPVLFAFSLPAAALLYALMTLDSAVRHARGLGTQWRDAQPQ